MNKFDKLESANISIALTYRAEELLTALGIDFRPIRNGFQLCCPLHSSDTPTSFTLYADEGAQGKWRCWSRNCHLEGHIDNTLGFLRGVLSVKADHPFGFAETVKWAKNFLGGDIPNYMVNVDLHQKRVEGNFARVSARPAEAKLPSIKSVSDRLLIPSPYFIGRGFSPEILTQFHVGEPKNSLEEGHSFFNRAVAPVLDRDGVGVSGYTARTKGDSIPRWKHVGFESSQTLYGYFEAQKAIAEMSEVILVEGPGKLWKLREAGIPNVVCTFGTNVLDGQQILLETSGALNLIVANDNNEAGEKGFQSTKSRLGRLFNITRKRPEKEDWDMHTAEEIKRILL